MGVYLNSETAYTLFKNETEKPYFVDKSLILEELFPLVKEGSNYICITPSAEVWKDGYGKYGSGIFFRRTRFRRYF